MKSILIVEDDITYGTLQHHLELARDKAEGVIKVIRLW